RQRSCGKHCCRQHDARQDAAYRCANTREVVSRAEGSAVGLDHWRSKLCAETREAELLSNLSRCQSKRSGRAAHEWKLDKRLIVQRPKHCGTGKRSYVWTRRRQHDRWRAAQHRAAEHLRVWKIEAGQVQRVIDFDPAVASRLEEDFEVVVNTDVEAQRDVDDVDIAWITIEIAVRNTERELPFS